MTGRGCVDAHTYDGIGTVAFQWAGAAALSPPIHLDTSDRYSCISGRHVGYMKRIKAVFRRQHPSRPRRQDGSTSHDVRDGHDPGGTIPSGWAAWSENKAAAAKRGETRRRRQSQHVFVSPNTLVGVHWDWLGGTNEQATQGPASVYPLRCGESLDPVLARETRHLSSAAPAGLCAAPPHRV